MQQVFAFGLWSNIKFQFAQRKPLGTTCFIRKDAKNGKSGKGFNAVQLNLFQPDFSALFTKTVCIFV